MNKAKLGRNPKHNNTRVIWSACRDLQVLSVQCFQGLNPSAARATLSHLLRLMLWPQ